MNNFEILYNNKELNDIIDSINRVNENNLFACHGRYHTTFVINTIEKILTKLNFEKDIIEAGKIAGLLHDIGTIKGKNGHAQRSSEMGIHFLNKTSLTQKNKNIIIHAIEDHSNGNEITSPIGAALLLADKIDISKNRVLKLGKKDPWHSNLLNIDEAILNVENNNIIINYIVNNKFDKDLLLEWKKCITIPFKACNYLNCNCIFQFNGKTYDFDIIKNLRNKKLLRKEYLIKRDNVLDKERKSLEMNKSLIKCDKFINSKVVALYNSINSEADMSEAAKCALESGKTLVYPKVIDDTTIEFYQVNNLNEWQNGAFSIKEPMSNNLVPKDKIDLMIIPGIAFDKRRYRIGYGKGYYDRYLNNTNIYKIGICFDEQIIDDFNIDKDDYDIQLDMIITDKRII